MYNILDNIKVATGQTIRMNCPSCKGYNTFSVTNEMGRLKWNCFKASCNVKGDKSVSLSVEDVKNYGKQTKKEVDFVMPLCIVPHRNNRAVIKWCAEWGLDVDKLGLLLDVKEDRVVFPVEHAGKVVDATGRALTWRQPKWKRYGSCGLPYTCGTGDVAVVVEDCISAAVAGDVKRIVGVALLGTSLLEEHKQYLMQFSKVVMALDPDATRKTIEYQKQLRSYVETVEVLKLNDDIKYRNPEDMKKIGDL